MWANIIPNKPESNLCFAYNLKQEGNMPGSHDTLFCDKPLQVLQRWTSEMHSNKDITQELQEVRLCADYLSKSSLICPNLTFIYKKQITL